jgi:hypothetical protein
MSAIEEALSEVWETSSETLAEAARAELAALRATIEAQARQLEQARKLIEYVMPSVEPYMVTRLRAWLAANAPEQEQTA